MRKMLKAEPMDRIAAADALCHPYFDGLHEQCEVVAKYLPHSMVRERAESAGTKTPKNAAMRRVQDRLWRALEQNATFEDAVNLIKKILDDEEKADGTRSGRDQAGQLGRPGRPSCNGYS